MTATEMRKSDSLKLRNARDLTNDANLFTTWRNFGAKLTVNTIDSVVELHSPQLMTASDRGMQFKRTLVSTGHHDGSFKDSSQN